MTLPAPEVDAITIARDHRTCELQIGGEVDADAFEIILAVDPDHVRRRPGPRNI